IANIDVTPDCQQTLGNGHVTINQSALDHGVDRELRLQFPPQRNPFQQGAGTIDARQTEGERSVQVKMRVHKGWRKKPAERIHFGRTGCRQTTLDRYDAVAEDSNINV